MTKQSLYGHIKHGVKGTTDVTMAVAGVALLIMMLVTMIDVFFRRIGHPLVGVYEISELLMIPTVYLGLPYVQRVSGHAEVDLFFNRIPKTPGRIITVICNLAVLGYLGLMIYKCLERAFYVMQRAEKSALLGVPSWLLYLLVCLGAGLTVIVVFLHTVDCLTGGRRTTA